MSMQQQNKLRPFDTAIQGAPKLSNLMQKVRLANRMRACLDELMTPPMRSHVQAGPIEPGVFALLVSSSAVATRLKQLEPAILTRLRNNGYDIEKIRIKIL
jgi:hypothetical protein